MHFGALPNKDTSILNSKHNQRVQNPSNSATYNIDIKTNQLFDVLRSTILGMTICVLIPLHMQRHMMAHIINIQLDNFTRPISAQSMQVLHKHSPTYSSDIPLLSTYMIRPYMSLSLFLLYPHMTSPHW